MGASLKRSICVCPAGVKLKRVGGPNSLAPVHPRVTEQPQKLHVLKDRQIATFPFSLDRSEPSSVWWHAIRRQNS